MMDYEEARKAHRRDIALKVARQLFSYENSILDAADLIENAIETYTNPCEKIFDHKYLNPDCVENGCQYLCSSRDAEHAQFAAEACKVVADEWKAIHDKEVAEWQSKLAASEDAAHTLVCQAVTLLNNGETLDAHMLLRKWLMAWSNEKALEETQ